MNSLRPPLPPPLSHEGISFALGRGDSGRVPDEVTLLIANAISAALPQGDFVVTKKGTLLFSASESLTSWQTAARLEANIRGGR
jgi:hypothetical protein